MIYLPNAAEEPVLSFLHINKNGGTTTRKVLRQNYPSKEYLEIMIPGRHSLNGKPKHVDGLDVDLNEALAHINHCERYIPFGMHKYMRRSVRYISFVREPVARCISFWYEMHRYPEHSSLWKMCQRYNFNLSEILKAGSAYELANDQVRMLSGSPNPKPGSQEIELAKKNIRDHFLFVGILEDFATGVSWLSNYLGWANADVTIENRGDYTNASLLPDNARDQFMNANSLDLELYQWIKEEYYPEKLGLLLDKGL
jgi:hypothetical protein